jgi:tRNA(Ile)-lysidine synthase
MAFPEQIEVATVDHGLRPAAAVEAAMVARHCAERGIRHATLRPEQPIAGSVQAQARTVRYRLLGGWMEARDLSWLMTAHHADDQMETVLMRLNRGSGVAGLSGIRARRDRVLRPLLRLRKADLHAHVVARAVPFVDDPSNADIRFDRARLRAELADADWINPAAAAVSAAALADADAALAWSVAELIARHVRRQDDRLILDRTDLPREYLRRILIDMMVQCTPEARIPRGESIDQAIIQLFHDRQVSIGACLATGGSTWTIRRAPPRRTG